MNEGTIRFQRRQTAYTQISNAALRDKRMSLAVRGLFALMLSLPPDRDYKTAYLVKVSDIGRDTLFRYFGILEKFGYLKRQQSHKKDGQFGSNTYFLDDNPVSPCMDFPNTVEPDTAEPDTVLPDTENADAKERTKRKNTPPISPQGDKLADPVKVCQWNEERFLRFWDFYRTVFCASDHSRAGERGAAAKAWDKLKPDDVTIGKLGAKLEAIMQTRQWQDGIGIMMASTLINRVRRGEISLDDLPTPSAPRRSVAPEPAREEDQWIS